MKQTIKNIAISSCILALGACATVLEKENKRDASFSQLKGSSTLETPSSKCPNGFINLKLTERAVGEKSGSYVEGAAVLSEKGPEKAISWTSIVDPSIEGPKAFTDSFASSKLKTTNSPSKISVALGTKQVQAKMMTDRATMISEMLPEDADASPVINSSLGFSYVDKNKIHLAIDQKITNFPESETLPEGIESIHELKYPMFLISSVSLGFGKHGAEGDKKDIEILAPVPASILTADQDLPSVAGTSGGTLDIPVGSFGGTVQVSIFQKKEDGHSLYYTAFHKASGGKVSVNLTDASDAPLAAGDYRIRVHGLEQSVLSDVPVGATKAGKVCIMSGKGYELPLTIAEAAEKGKEV